MNSLVGFDRCCRAGTDEQQRVRGMGVGLDGEEKRNLECDRSADVGRSPSCPIDFGQLRA